MNWQLTLLFIKLGGLLSACGGPMLLMDRLKGRWGMPAAFTIGFLPIALMIMGALHLGEPPIDRLARRFVEVGRVAMVFMVAMQLYGIWLIVGGLQSPALPLYYVGIATGLVSALIYQMAATRTLAPSRAASASAPHDREPIEPR